jgi:phosphatidate cytidylyltransferase
MLRWRLLLGILLVAALAGLGWLDSWLYRLTGAESGGIRGIALFPLLLLIVVTASREMIELAAASGGRPAPWVVYCGNLLVASSCWIVPIGRRVGWGPWETPGGFAADAAAGARATLIALAAGVILAFSAEMARFKNPGGATANLAAAILGLVYVGLLLSFVVGLLVVWGIGALVSLLIVVKLGDVGAYTVGRLVGRHKMAPRLSPGKTVEGAIGAMVFAWIGAWIAFRCFGFRGGAAGLGPPFHWLLFASLVAGAGMVGDLAESLLKRDVAQKDSSRWLPGFGGVLDIMDSILFAAPVAYACWAGGLIA